VHARHGDPLKYKGWVAREMARRAPPAKPSRRPRPVPLPNLARPLPRRAHVALLEEPHAHVVCRVCGRIQRIELTELDRHVLTEMAERHPEDWAVDGIAFSLTGACRRCREGPGS
jgi:hypothetical protein